MKAYLDVVRTILRDGTRKESRTGVDTLSTFGVPYRVDLRDGFPLLTTKEVSWKNIVIENLWFLSGDPTIGLLRKHGCKFWDAWADDDGRVPSAYGNFWRQFPVHDAENGTYTNFHPDSELLGADYKEDHPVWERPTPAGWNDQIEWAIDELKRNPMSRRVVVSAWAPGNAQTSKLPPCHVVMVFNVQNLSVKCGECQEGIPLCQIKIGGMGACCKCGGTGYSSRIKPHLCLHLTQRSCDIALGVPYNLAGYAFLLELFSRFTGIPVGIFSHMLVDAHAYTSKPDGSMAEYDHVPGLWEQLTREPRSLPRLTIDESIQTLDDIRPLMGADTETVMGAFQLEGYNPHPAIKFKVAV